MDYDKLSGTRRGEPSKVIRARVEAARQRRRFVAVDDNAKHLLTNADMGPGEIREFCPVDDAGHSLLRAAMRQPSMSARAYHRSLMLARTIADLAGAVPHARSGVLRKEASHSGSRLRIWRRQCSTGQGGRYSSTMSS